ncbi:hypothetical protein TNCV_387911 [Trichonephila clavipes]|nr:hypothetical protein TNCV_387911 [Trichonephila clavipes]
MAHENHRVKRLVYACLSVQHHTGGTSEPGVVPYQESLHATICQQNNARLRVVQSVQQFLIALQFVQLPWLICFPDLSLIEHMRSMIGKQLPQLTPTGATPD